MRTLIFLAFMALLGFTQSPQTHKAAQQAEVAMSDPHDVVAKTCAPATSPLCSCIVKETVKTLESGPREILAAVRRPGAVWAEVAESLDPARRITLEAARTATEHDCRRRLVPSASRITTMDRMVRAVKKPKRSLRSSCSSEGGSSSACACYEKTLLAALTQEDFEVVREDASFPPLLEDMPVDRRRMALAAMASARAACGVGSKSS